MSNEFLVLVAKKGRAKNDFCFCDGEVIRETIFAEGRMMMIGADSAKATTTCKAKHIDGINSVEDLAKFIAKSMRSSGLGDDPFNRKGEPTENEKYRAVDRSYGIGVGVDSP